MDEIDAVERRLSAAARGVLEGAEQECRGAGAPSPQPAHLFVALCALCGREPPAVGAELEVRTLKRALAWTGRGPEGLAQRLRAALDAAQTPSSAGGTVEVLKLADRRRAESGDGEIRLSHLLRALAELDWPPRERLFLEMGIAAGELVRRTARLPGAGEPAAEPGVRDTIPLPRRLEAGSPLVEAVLVVDICDSTDMGQRYGDHLLVRLKGALSDIAREAASAHQETFLKGIGDGFLMTFPGCGQAVSVAQEILRGMRRYNASHPGQPAVGLRFGLNFGEVFVDALGDRSGNAVNLAFRVQATRPSDMHETKQGISRSALPDRDRIFVTHSVFKELSAAGSPFECLMLGYFGYKGFDGMRMAVYAIAPEA